MAMLLYKCDESLNERFMSVGGWLGEADEWMRLETSWQNHINKLNSVNKPNQRISRYHAARLNGFREEFCQWDDAMSQAFSRKLIGLLGKRRFAAVCMSVDMDALTKVFRSDGGNRKDLAYALCIKSVMVELGHIMRDYFPNDQVQLIHDHGNWDGMARAAYNSMINDVRWANREVFAGIGSLTGGTSIGLQAADLIVFECHKKVVSQHSGELRQMRKSMKLMISKRLPVIAKYLDEPTALILRGYTREGGVNDEDANI